MAIFTVFRLEAFVLNLRCGIDIVEISRIKGVLESQGERFKTRVFTQEEIKYCDSRRNNSIESYAAAFCAKEAVSKALGTGFSNGIEMKDIEVLHDEKGRPHITLYNNARRVFEEAGASEIAISLTHCREYAAANCVIS
jgi:holo-[acyl-carrier-protein] synthase